MAWNVLSPSLAARVAATLVAVSVFAALFVRVITDQHRRLEALAITDPLTGPMDRAPLAAVLDDAVAQHERSGVPVSLVALDVDHFKGINDTFGHDVGDEVLQRVGILLQARKRRTDRIFRLGGEEFLLVLNATDGPGAVRVDDELRTAIEREPLVEGRDVTVSVGVTQLEAGERWSRWVKRADEHLYQGKAEGRNRVVGDLPLGSPDP